MSERQQCPGRGWRYSPPCQNYGKYEHDGKLYCKAHHPPTVDAKNAEKARLRKDKFEADQTARAEHRQRQEEIERKAAEHDAVVAQRDELLECLRNADKLITQLMPGVRHIALQDYGFLNDTLMANAAAIAKVEGRT